VRTAVPRLTSRPWHRFLCVPSQALRSLI